MKVRDRAAEIRGIFYTHCKEIIDGLPSFDINESKKLRNYGTISEEIVFIDGSLLNFFERIVDGNIAEYSYEYLRPDTGFFFHYQNEGIENGIRKPLHHLHVGIKKDANKNLSELIPKELLEHGGPHYKAPKIDFNELMGMIIVNFFENHRNCERMIRSLRV
ncbi:Uncharacterised protein [uncultured archaeon]|nr:Uncharacterised protein [uncultured archaeon]